jgi:hypothetical protein
MSVASEQTALLSSGNRKAFPSFRTGNPARKGKRYTVPVRKNSRQPEDMTFKKTKENFICEHCREGNIGNGFTNHCKKCLWSKHVDIDPGDRLAICGGMMEPVEIGMTNKEYRILHQCVKCGFDRASAVNPDDNFDKVLKIFAETSRKA